MKILNPGGAFAQTELARFDLVHFGGKLTSSLLDAGHIQAVNMSLTGSATDKMLFVRSKYKSWSEHPGLAQFLGKTAESDEKSLTIADSLVKSGSYRWVVSGSNRVFTNIENPVHGRNRPSRSFLSKGLFDVDHWTAAGVAKKGKPDTFSLLSGVVNEYDNLKHQDLTKLIDLIDLLSVDPTRELEDDEEYTEIEEWVIATRDAIVEVVEGTEDGKLVSVVGNGYESGKFLLQIGDGPLLANCDFAGRAQLMKSLPDHNLEDDVAAAIRLLCFANAVAEAYEEAKWAANDVERRKFPGLKVFVTRAKKELEQKGFVLTGNVRAFEMGPITSGSPIAFEWEDGSSDLIDSTGRNTAPPHVATRHGCGLVVYIMWNAAIAFEVIDDSPYDVLVISPHNGTGVTDTDAERQVVSYRSFFRGGVIDNTTIASSEASLKEAYAFYMSSVDERWHPGSPDPLQHLADEVEPHLADVMRHTGPHAVKLNRYAVDKIEDIGIPHYYLPLAAPVGGMKACYVASDNGVNVTSSVAVLHQDVTLETPIEDAFLPETPTTVSFEDPEGVFNGGVQAGDDEGAMVNERAVGFDVHVDVNVERYLGSMSAESIVYSAMTGNGYYKPMKKKELKDLENFTAQFEGKNFAFVVYDKPQQFPSKIVERTELYRQYKKAREKACKLNNFLSTSFIGKTTWGQAQDAVTAKGSSNVLFGLFDKPTLIDLDASIDYTKVTYTYQVGTSPAILSRKAPDGTVTVVSSDSADVVFGEISIGAKLSGIGLAALSASWTDGNPNHEIEQEMKDIKDSSLSITDQQSRARSATGGAGLDWGPNSYSVNGFPQVDKLLYQDALKAIIMSVNVYAKVGPQFMTLLERNNGKLISSGYPRAAKKIAKTEDLSKIFV